MFLDLSNYKQKVSWSDSIIASQDTLIVRQVQAIESQKKDVEVAQSITKEANFRATFYENFADKQQENTIKIIQKQNKIYLILGASLGVLITLLITK